MKLSFKRTKGALIGALFVLVPVPSRGFNFIQTAAPLPEGKLQLSQTAGYRYLGDGHAMNYGTDAGLGITDSLFFRAGFESMAAADVKQSSGINDVDVNLGYSPGYIFGDSIILSFGVDLRFCRAGRDDALADLRYADNADVLLPYAALSFPFSERLMIHVNAGYAFREEEEESLYGGFNLRINDKEAYKQLFGLNPFSDGAFMEFANFKNDYIITGVGVNSGHIYPVVPYAEFMSFIRFTGKGIADGESGHLFQGRLAFGLRYFLSDSAFAGISALAVFYGFFGEDEAAVISEFSVRF